MDDFPEAVLFVRGGDGRILLANAAASRLLDANVEGRAVSDMGVELKSSSGESFKAQEHPLLMPALVPERESEALLVLADGREIDVAIKVGPVHDQHGELVGALAVLHDVSARRALEQHREDMVWVASHELRAPLTSLKGWTQYAQRRAVRGETNDPADLLATLAHQIARMEVLLDQLLDSARLEQQIELAQEDFDLRSSISGLLATLPPEWAARVRFRNSEPVMVHGDRWRLEGVMLNLLTNALKYSPPEGRVRVVLRRAGQHLLVAVRDWGPGISSQDLPHVFERFYRSKGWSPRTGFGLGLYIAHETIERHGSELLVRSVEGQGTTFAFTLPLSGKKPAVGLAIAATAELAGSTQ